MHPCALFPRSYSTVLYGAIVTLVFMWGCTALTPILGSRREQSDSDAITNYATFFSKSCNIFVRPIPIIHFLTSSFHSRSEVTSRVCLWLIRLTQALPLTPECEQSVCAVSSTTCFTTDTVFPWTRLSPPRNLAWNQSRGATFHRCGFAAASWRPGLVSEIRS